jgi:probable rRNA maturation factor
VTTPESNVFISGDLEGLSCSEKNVIELIELLVQAEPSLQKKLKSRHVNLTFITKNEIKELNSKFLNKDQPTNVLSFPSSGLDFEEQLLGDIAICPEIIINEADDQNKDQQNHLSHIILHSLLHLAGYDHQEDSSAEKMESLEIEALKKLGIANPY